MKQVLMALVCGAAALATTHGAEAAVLTQVFDSTTRSTFAAGTAMSTPVDVSGSFSGTINLQTFDPALGTLTSLTFSTSINGSVTAFLIGSQGDSYRGVTADAPYTLTSSSGGVNQSAFGYADQPPGNGNTSANGLGPGFTGTAPAAGRTNVGTNAFSLSGGNLTTTLTGSQLASYIGAGGSYSLSFLTGSIQTAGNIPANDAIGGFSDEAVKVTITANYTVGNQPPVTVPEPASMALAGLAVAATCLIRRVRSARTTL